MKRDNLSRMREAFYKLVGKRIADEREKAKLTQDELAERVGLSRPSIANVEQGRQAIPLHKFFEIAAAMGVAAVELMPGDIAAATPKVHEAKHANLSTGEVEFANRVLNKVR